MNEKVHISPNVQIPMPVAIIGTEFMGKPNFMTVGWISRVNASPPMIGFGVRTNRRTANAIMQHKEFSINIPGKDIVRETDYVGMVSSDVVDKSEVFKVDYGILKSAPLIREAGLSLECKLVDMHHYPSNTFIVGEIVSAWANKNLVHENEIDFARMKAFFLTMPDNRYWSMGKSFADAWEIKQL